MNKNFLKSTVAMLIISAFTLVGCSNPNKELAKVGDYVITQKMITKELKPYIDSYKTFYPDLSDDDLKQYEEELEGSMVQYFAEIEALCLEANENNYVVEQEILDESYEYAVQQVQYYFDMEMEEFCTKYNFDLNYVKESVERQTIASNYLFDSAIVSEEDIKAYYEENKEAFKMIQASHILISNENEYLPEDSSSESDGSHVHDDGTVHTELTEKEETELAKIKEENLKKAEEILKKAKNGEDFKSLSDQYSDDTVAKEQGGDLGFFTLGTMVEEFENAAFDSSLKKNEIYDKVVTTAYGYHIIKKTDEKYQTLEEASANIEQELTYIEAEEFLANIRKKYNIASDTSSN